MVNEHKQEHKMGKHKKRKHRMVNDHKQEHKMGNQKKRKYYYYFFLYQIAL